MINSNQNSRTNFINPIVTFTTIIVFGVVVALFVVKNDALIAPIIILSFIVGGVVTGFEIRRMVKKSIVPIKEKSDEKEMDQKEKLARYVSDLFEEDIPFDKDENDQDLNDNKSSLK